MQCMIVDRRGRHRKSEKTARVSRPRSTEIAIQKPTVLAYRLEVYISEISYCVSYTGNTHRRDEEEGRGRENRGRTESRRRRERERERGKRARVYTRVRTHDFSTVCCCKYGGSLTALYIVRCNIRYLVASWNDNFTLGLDCCCLLLLLLLQYYSFGYFASHDVRAKSSESLLVYSVWYFEKRRTGSCSVDFVRLEYACSARVTARSYTRRSNVIFLKRLPYE